MERVFKMPFSSVYPHYVNKVQKKGRTVAELHQVLTWLTGYSDNDLALINQNNISFETFFAEAPQLHPNCHLITGVICGHRVENIEDPLMQKIRWMDKLVDELAKGKKMEQILRTT